MFPLQDNTVEDDDKDSLRKSLEAALASTPKGDATMSQLVTIFKKAILVLTIYSYIRTSCTLPIVRRRT